NAMTLRENHSTAVESTEHHQTPALGDTKLDKPPSKPSKLDNYINVLGWWFYNRKDKDANAEVTAALTRLSRRLKLSHGNFNQPAFFAEYILRKRPSAKRKVYAAMKRVKTRIAEAERTPFERFQYREIYNRTYRDPEAASKVIA